MFCEASMTIRRSGKNTTRKRHTNTYKYRCKILKTIQENKIQWHIKRLHTVTSGIYPRNVRVIQYKNQYLYHINRMKG